MTPLEVAARFAAIVWYWETVAPDLGTPEEARGFAREYWEAFLPVANEGVGKLLLRMAHVPPRKKRQTRKCSAALAG